jgi:hypothetical protein
LGIWLLETGSIGSKHTTKSFVIPASGKLRMVKSSNIVLDAKSVITAQGTVKNNTGGLDIKLIVLLLSIRIWVRVDI